MTGPTRPYIAPFLNLYPEIDNTAFIAATAAVVGAVRVGAGSSIWHQVTLRGDNNISPLAMAPIFKTIVVCTSTARTTQRS